MFHTTVEYRYRGLGMFLDTGAVWDARAERRVRVSTGVTFNPGPVFFTLGFPVNTDEFRAVFTMGFRFSSASVGIKKHRREANHRQGFATEGTRLIGTNGAGRFHSARVSSHDSLSLNR